MVRAQNTNKIVSNSSPYLPMPFRRSAAFQILRILAQVIEYQVRIQDIRRRTSIFRRQTFVANHFAQLAQMSPIVGKDLLNEASLE